MPVHKSSLGKLGLTAAATYFTGGLGGSLVGAALNGDALGLGGGSSASQISSPNRSPLSTGNSTLDNGNLSLNPAIGGIRGNVQSGLESQLSSLQGNQNQYVQARVNPLLSRIEKGRGSLQRSLSRRGVFGSFGDQALTNYDVDTQRSLGDARSLATNESIGQQNVIQNQLMALANQLQAGELSGLGLASNRDLGFQQLGQSAATNNAQLSQNARQNSQNRLFGLGTAALSSYLLR